MNQSPHFSHFWSSDIRPVPNLPCAQMYSVAAALHRHSLNSRYKLTMYLSLLLSSSSSDSLSDSSFFIFFSFCFGVFFFPNGVSFSFLSAFSGVSSTSLFSLLLSFNLSCVLSSSVSFLAGVASRTSLLRPYDRNGIYVIFYFMTENVMQHILWTKVYLRF